MKIEIKSANLNKRQNEKMEKIIELGNMLLNRYLDNYEAISESSSWRQLYLRNLPYYLVICLQDKNDEIIGMTYDDDLNVLKVNVSNMIYSFYVSNNCLYFNEKQLTKPTIILDTPNISKTKIDRDSLEALKRNSIIGKEKSLSDSINSNQEAEGKVLSKSL